MRFKPLDDRIIVKPLPVQTQTESGIYLPDEAQEPADEGDVVAVGPGARIDGTDERATMAVKVGDRIHYGRYSGYKVKIDGEDYFVLKEDQVLMIEAPLPNPRLVPVSQEWMDDATAGGTGSMIRADVEQAFGNP